MTYELIADLMPEAESQILSVIQLNHPNYIIYKKDVKVRGGISFDEYFPDKQVFYLCDTDDKLHRHLTSERNLPVIALRHLYNRKEDLIECPVLILDASALTPEYLDEIFHRHYGLPLTILETDRVFLREFTMNNLNDLILLDKENEGQPDACFFPADYKSYDDRQAFLSDYISHQYPFYGYGIYGIFQKEGEVFIGISGFASGDILRDHVPVSYAILQKYQGKGYAKEAVAPLSGYAKEYFEFSGCYARIRPENQPSIRLVEGLNYQRDPSDLNLWFCQA